MIKEYSSPMLNRLFYKKRVYDDDFDWDNYTSDSYERRIKGDIESKYVTKVERSHQRSTFLLAVCDLMEQYI